MVRTVIGGSASAVRLWDQVGESVVVDRHQRLPGRGCYLHRGCADAAVRRRAVGRALRRTVDGDQVAALLATDGLA
ncbi:MAG: hypothetical protein DI570_32400 [Phenylobacterium zucineum]|nr:MAG: hypothetical protein DI570_32400 [Phenylobacterium zucineum]